MPTLPGWSFHREGGLRGCPARIVARSRDGDREMRTRPRRVHIDDVAPRSHPPFSAESLLRFGDAWVPLIAPNGSKGVITCLIRLAEYLQSNRAGRGKGSDACLVRRRGRPVVKRSPDEPCLWLERFLACPSTIPYRRSRRPSQLQSLPRDASHLIVSIGGNDALLASGVLDERATSVADALEKLAAIAYRFSGDYSAMLGRALAGALPTAVCTIYEPRFPQPARRKVAATALTLLNDRITREAFSRR